MAPILTAKVGDNSDQFPDILALYIPEGSHVLDMTWGNGVFWKQVDQSKYELDRNDIDEERGDSHYDFRQIPCADGSYDAVILDPPYLYTGGFKTLKDSIDRGYKNRERAQETHGVEAVDEMYRQGIVEAYRLLKKGGVFVVKCMDQVMSGKQVWASHTYHDMAVAIGFRSDDLFVMVQKNTPTMRHKHQIHARRNHSYWLVFRKVK